MDEVCTGDLLLFSSVGFPSFIIKVAIISEYHHVGVAMRVQDGKIVLRGGDLCVYDVNSTQRIDKLHGGKAEIAVEDFANIKKKGWYTIIAYRSLDSKYHTPDFIPRIREFIDKHADYKFNHGRLAMLTAWVRLPFGSQGGNEVICSELVTKFYRHCLHLQSDDGHVYNPGHYAKAGWISSGGQFHRLFTTAPTPLAIEHSDWTSLIGPFLLPIVITIIVVWLIWRATP